MTAPTLKPCPFCGSDLLIRPGVNGYGHCKTEGCYANRAQTVPLDDPKQVAAWNLRPEGAVAWQSGKPASPGIYLCHSDTDSRRANAPSLYAWDGERFQHHSGWYDNAITHWIKTDLPASLGDGS